MFCHINELEWLVFVEDDLNNYMNSNLTAGAAGKFSLIGNPGGPFTDGKVIEWAKL